MATRVIRIDPRAAWLDELAPAVEALRAGRLVAFGTETVYGLGVVATNASALERLREMKSRPKSPFTVHLAWPGEFRRYVQDVPWRARALMSRAWPGPLTILLPVGEHLAAEDLRRADLYRRICPEGLVGLRCPDDRVALELLRRVHDPVLATSANLAGQSPPATADDVLAQLEGRIDLVVDTGAARYAKASTIVACRDDGLRVVRAGVYDARAIERMSRYNLLFVCTGNTCRSPMAAAFARKLLSERLGVSEGKLAQAGVEVRSAGLLGSGAPASALAVQAAAGLGARIGKHRSRKLTAELIRSADLVFCMTRDHVVEVARMVPDASGRTALLDPGGDIEDPVAGEEQTYAGVAKRIAGSLEARIREYWP